MITKEEFEKLATLSRLAVKDEDYPHFFEDLSQMVMFADKIRELSFEEDEHLHIDKLQTSLSEDVVLPGTRREDILKNAPCSQDGYFLLRKRA